MKFSLWQPFWCIYTIEPHDAKSGIYIILQKMCWCAKIVQSLKYLKILTSTSQSVDKRPWTAWETLQENIYQEHFVTSVQLWLLFVLLYTTELTMAYNRSVWNLFILILLFFFSLQL